MKNCKSVLGIVGFIVMVCFMIGVLSIVMRPIDSDIRFNTLETFRGMPEDSLDVIGFGSSHMWRGMVPMELYQEYGIGAYNYGCSWQHINTILLFIQDALKTQSPNLILVETFNVNGVLQNVDMNGEIYYTKVLDEDEAKFAYLKQCFGSEVGRYVSYYVPLFQFHENWISLGKNNFYVNADQTDFYTHMGYRYLTGVTAVNAVDPTTFNQKALGNAALSVLDTIVSICAERDIDVLFYTAPYSGQYAYSDAMKEYAQKHDCAYLDLFEYLEEMNFDWEVDMADAGHVNYSGALKVSNQLGEYISEHYDLEDMREVENNIWASNLEKE